MRDNTAFRTWLFAFVATTIMVVMCIAYVDRPVAVFFDRHLRHTVAWDWLNRALAPLDLAVVMALLFLLGCDLGCVRALASFMDSNAPALLLGRDVGNRSRHHLQAHFRSRLARSGVHSEPPLRVSPPARRSALGIVPLRNGGDLRCDRIGSLDRDAALASYRCGDR